MARKGLKIPKWARRRQPRPRPSLLDQIKHPDAKRMVLGLAKTAETLQEAGERLFPGIPWRQWTPKMWDMIYDEAERIHKEAKESASSNRK